MGNLAQRKSDLRDTERFNGVFLHSDIMSGGISGRHIGPHVQNSTMGGREGGLSSMRLWDPRIDSAFQLWRAM